MAQTIVENDIYRQKVFVQAESNRHAADILAMELSTNSQAIMHYQQSAESYLKGAMIKSKDEHLLADNIEMQVVASILDGTS